MWIYFIGVITTILLELLIVYLCKENLTLGDLSLLIIVSLLSWFSLWFVIICGSVFIITKINWDKIVIKFKK